MRSRRLFVVAASTTVSAFTTSPFPSSSRSIARRPWFVLSGGGPVVSYTTSAATVLQAAASATPVEQPIEISGLTNNDNSKKESGEDTTSIPVRGKVLNRQSDGSGNLFVVVQVLEDTSWDGSATPTTTSEVVPTAVKNLFGTTAIKSPATPVVPISKKLKMEGTFSLLFIV